MICGLYIRFCHFMNHGKSKYPNSEATNGEEQMLGGVFSREAFRWLTRITGWLIAGPPRGG